MNEDGVAMAFLSFVQPELSTAYHILMVGG